MGKKCRIAITLTVRVKIIPVRPDAHRIAKQVADRQKLPIIKIVTDAVLDKYQG